MATLGGPPGPGFVDRTTPRPAHSIHGCRCGALPEWARRFLCLALWNVGATSPSPSQVGQTAYVLTHLCDVLAFALALEGIWLPCVAVACRAAEGESNEQLEHPCAAGG